MKAIKAEDFEKIQIIVQELATKINKLNPEKNIHYLISQDEIAPVFSLILHNDLRPDYQDVSTRQVIKEVYAEEFMSKIQLILTTLTIVHPE